jgi:hypothetical protein
MNATVYDTVRLARQLAREVGCTEPIEILCVEQNDSYFERLKKVLLEGGDYNIERAYDYDDMTEKLMKRAKDFCVFSLASHDAQQIAAVCKDLKMPVLIFDSDQHTLTGPFESSGVIQYFNGKLHKIPVSWSSLNTGMMQALRCCSIMV